MNNRISVNQMVTSEGKVWNNNFTHVLSKLLGFGQNTSDIIL